jgi:anti-sigma factor RsiW
MSHQDDPREIGSIHARQDDGTAGDARSETEHPSDEALGAFVGGTASPQEQAEIERHLAGCDACAQDVAAARGAREALRSVSEVDSPWTDDVESLVAAATSPAPAVGIRERRGASVRWRGTAAAALAAAAVLTGVIVLLAHGGSNKSPQLSAAAPARPAAGARTVTQQSLFDLTRSLASSPNTTANFGASEGAPGPATTSGIRKPNTSPSASLLAADAVGGIPCARRASAQPVSALAIYAQSATFNGKPVWVIGFVSAASPGGAAHVEVVAVTTSDCSVAFLARQPLAS